MQKLLLSIILLTVATLVNAEVSTGIGHTMKSDGKASAPAGHAMYQPPAAATAQGKVLESIDGAGYTYLRLESAGKEYWVAGTSVKVKTGDMVSYDENVVMHDFFSKSMNKTFNKIIFASHVKVAN